MSTPYCPAISPKKSKVLTLPERQFQAQVRELAAWTGWMIYHTYNSKHSPCGFPDLVLARSPRLIFAELKTESGKLTPEQSGWLGDLARVPNVETYCWRPNDIDEISRILARQKGGAKVG